MTGFPTALRRSLLLTLFLMVVCLGFLGLLALPAVGKQLGPLVCEAGETLNHATSTYSIPGETTTQVSYFCEGAGGPRPVGTFDLIKAALVPYAGFFLLVVWPLLALRTVRAVARVERIQREGIPATVRILSAHQTSTRINDLPVIKFDLEVQPQGLPSFTKSIKRAIPELLLPRMQPGNVLQGLLDPRKPTEVMIQFEQVAEAAAPEPQGSAGDSGLEAMRALQKMFDEGLISDEEFAAKKAEILREL